MDEIRNDLIKTEKGILLQGIENCLTVFHRDPLLRGAIRRNELTNRTDIVKDLGWLRYSGTTVTDLDEYQIQLYFEKNYGLKNAQNIDKAISIVAS